MLQDLTIKTILDSKINTQEKVMVQGWVRTVRESKAGVAFIHLSDGSCFALLQIVAPNTLGNFESEIKKITTGCALKVTGSVVASQGKEQAVEILADAITVLGWVEDPESYPMQPKRHSMEYLREVAHLRPRTNLIGAVMRIRHTLSQAIHQFLHEHGFYWIHTPIITANDCEGAGQLFRVTTMDFDKLPRLDSGKIDFSQDFFGKETHLTVSGQLNVETYCMALSRVYTFGPTFRAENSNTRRHLAEFWMVEPEMAFADLMANVDLAEKFLKAIFIRLLNERNDDMKFFAQWVDKQCIARLEQFVAATFEKIDYSQAINMLQKSNKQFEYPVFWGMDLQSEHERYLTEEVVKAPCVVINYPKDLKAFYMRLNDDQKTVAAMDVLAPGIGEIIGGSQREERLDVLDHNMKAKGLNPEDYSWYRDLRRYGSVPHAGFGLGLERAIQYATGIENIRDVIPFPRAPNLADF